MRLTDLLDERPDDATTVAVYCDEREVTRADLRVGARSLARVLTAAGVRPGQAVGVMLPNGPEVVAAMFGVWMAGAVHVPLNPRQSSDELRHVAESVRPAALVVDAGSAGHARELRPVGLPTITSHGDLGWRAETSAAHPAGREPACYDSDIALVQFTSGTTGRPRPVLLSHSGYLALLEPVLRKLVGGSARGLAERRAPMPNLIPTSMTLSAGIYNVLFAFRVGAAVVILPRFTTAGFAAAVARHRIRSTVLPPAAMTMLTDDSAIATLASLRYVRGITAPLSPLQARRFRDRFGVTVLNCYGQTEIGGEIVGWNVADAREYGERKLGAVGRPHEGVTLRVVGPDGAEAAADVSGELYVRTPAVSAGYADGSGLGDRVTPDGWFRTGDVARVDPDGFLWIEGRVSDMINRGGLKVFPAEVEEVLRLAAGVADCAVVGVPDDRLGEVPWAFVVPAAGARPGPGALGTLVRAHLAPYKVPVRFVLVDELPRTEVGKVRAVDLVALAAGR